MRGEEERRVYPFVTGNNYLMEKKALGFTEDFFEQYVSRNFARKKRVTEETYSKAEDT
jgi:hypothetical protein